MNAALPTAFTSLAAEWSVRLAGEPHLLAADGRRIALEPRDAALVGYLAVEGHCARAWMLSALWSDAAEPVLRNRLRQRIYSLGLQLGGKVVVGRETLTLAPGLRWQGFDAEDDAQTLLGNVDLPGLADWLAALRERWHLHRRERLARQAEQLEREGRLAEAIVAAEGVLALEPLLEHAHRRLMRLHYLRGDRAAALAAFDRCERMLKDELGAPPGAETLELLSRVEQAQPPVPGLAVARRAVPASVLRPPRLVGREAEWARLQAAWARGDAIVVMGEAGMGKTRLVGDLAGLHAAAGGTVQVAARPGDERVPYALLGRLLRAVLATRSAPLPAGVEGELSRLLPELPQRETNAREGDAAGRARFVGAVDALLHEAVQAGLQAVVLDDLHFADAASLEFALHLVAGTGVRWLAAFRPAEIGAAARELVDVLVDTRGAEPLLLKPLDPAQTGELLRTLQLAEGDTTALAGALHRRTGGNPLFMLETLKALLTQSGGAEPGWAQAEALSHLPAAGSIGRLIARRLDRLSGAAVALARCAAVAGQDFSLPLAEQVMQTPALALADPWSELEGAQVIRGGAFAHDLVHEAVLAAVPEAIAAHLHGQVAAYLAGHAAEAARVAHHWQQAGQPGHAGPAWLEAARHCARRGRRAEQVQMLERAAAAFVQAGDRRAHFEALLERAQVLGQHAELESALAALEQAAAVAADDHQRLRLAVVGLDARVYHGEDEHALAHAPAALALARRLGERGSEFTLAAALCAALTRTGRAKEAVELMSALRPWVEAHGTPAHAYEYWNSMALALDYASRMRESLQAWEASRQVAEAHFGDLLSQATGNMAYTSAKMGDVRGAVALARQALQLAQGASDGFDHQVLEQQLALGHHLRNVGHYGEAVQLLESAAAGFRTGGRELRAHTADCLLAVAWSQLGQPARALQLTAADSGSPPPRVRAMRLAFRALALNAAGQDGRETLREALDLFADPGHLWFRTHTLIATALLPPEEALPLALQLTEWALANERFGFALAAESRAAGCALALGRARQALPHVEHALQLALHYQPDAFYLPELWCVAADVYAATGQEGARRQAVEDGTRWVAQVCSDHVPSAFRESFLHRNPVNRCLLSLAAAPATAAR